MMKSPNEYQAAAFLAKEAEVEMLSRLEWMLLKPAVIVDAGCGTGTLATALAERYPEAKVIAVDTNSEMLAVARLSQAIECRQEDACNLSLPNQSVDLLCANFLLPWVDDWEACLREWRRVLAPNGLLMISVLGVGTLPALQGVLPSGALPRLLDMHDVGDALVMAKFADPVIDAGRFPVRYRDQPKFERELHASGLLALTVALPACDLEVMFEVVHAHAFVPLPSSSFAADEDGTVRVPLAHLRRQRIVK
jgi:malonyl-CoA O-methyltransferase